MTASAMLSTATIDSGAGGRVSARPVPHDFPFPTCCVCRFPIPPWDLAGGEYEQRHASTCTLAATPDRTDGSDGLDQLGQAAVVVGAGGLPAVPPLGVKGASHRLRRQPAAARDPEPRSARRVAGAGTACPRKRPPAIDERQQP